MRTAWRRRKPDEAASRYLLALFVAVVVPLLANGVSDAWFGYRDQRATLDWPAP